MTPGEIIEQILDAFARNGHRDYGENISMKEHMLQTARLAEEDGEDDTMIVAALLHDYGHLVCDEPNDVFEKGADNRHEVLGAEALGEWFEASIVDVVRLHVDAKRYLCAADPDYRDKLSDASLTTLAVQGGAMDDSEMSRFREQPAYRSAIRLRIYDDAGKRPGMKRPGLEHYIPMIRRCLA